MESLYTMLAKDYRQPKTFCWVFHTHICRAHQASRAVPWLYCTHGSQSWPALAHLTYKILLPVPNSALWQRGSQYCVCVSPSVNHEGYRRISVMTADSQPLCTRAAAAAVRPRLGLPLSTPYFYLVLTAELLWWHKGLAAFHSYQNSDILIKYACYINSSLISFVTMFFRIQVFPQY